MFKTEKYRIRFERLPIDNESSKAGRYHTGCEIYLHDVQAVDPVYMGIAHLHPKDVPGKIIGKKEALKRALLKRFVVNSGPGGMVKRIPIWYMSKVERTMIWAAFWLWVQGWEKAKICKTCVFFGETKLFCFSRDNCESTVSKSDTCDYWEQR